MVATIPNFIPAALAAELVARLESQELQDGRATAGPAGLDLKLNQQLVDTPAALEMSQIISAHVHQNRELLDMFAIKSSLPFMFNCHREGMEYKPHADNAVMYFQNTELRTDLSATVFLSPPESYDGGELMIDLEERPTSIKLPAGGLVMYPSNTLHAVNPVTRGTRWGAVTWFQSRIRSHDQRRIYRTLGNARRALEFAQQHPRNSAERVAHDYILRVKDDLLRMWGD